MPHTTYGSIQCVLRKKYTGMYTLTLYVCMSDDPLKEIANVPVESLPAPSLMTSQETLCKLGG